MSDMSFEDQAEALEHAHHVIAQGGEVGYTDAQIEEAQQLIDRLEDPIMGDFDTVYAMCQLLRENLIDNADLRLHRHHHRQDLKETITDLDMIDRFEEVFKAEMDPRDEAR